MENFIVNSQHKYSRKIPSSSLVLLKKTNFNWKKVVFMVENFHVRVETIFNRHLCSSWNFIHSAYFFFLQYEKNGKKRFDALNSGKQI